MAGYARSKNWCSALNCHNGSAKLPKLSFYRFPKDKERCAKWVQNTRRADLLKKTPEYLYANCRICSDHFQDSQILNTGRLVWNAVPMFFSSDDPSDLKTRKQKSSRRCGAVNNLLFKTSTKIEPVVPLKAALGELKTHHTYASFSNSELADSVPESLKQTDADLPLEPKSVNMASDSEQKQPNTKETSLQGAGTLSSCTPNAQSPEIQRLRYRVQELQARLEKEKTKSSNCSCACSTSNQTILIHRLQAKVKELQRNGGTTRRAAYTSTERVKLHRLKIKNKKLQEMLKEKKQDTSSVEFIIEAAGKYLNGTALQLFASQLRIAKRRAKGRRYTQEDKLLALTLHQQNPGAYKLCREIFALPTKRSLQRVKVEPEVTYTMFDELSTARVEEVVCSVINDMNLTLAEETIIG